MSGFELHPRLAADTALIGDFSLCAVRLMNDARYPWVILVPRRANVREIHHLTAIDRHRLIDESCVVIEALETLAHPDKINIGALGNLVPQLHLHHIVRFFDDPAWPGPVWGHSEPSPYTDAERAVRIRALRGYLQTSSDQELR